MTRKTSMYGLVLIFFVVGFLFVSFHSKTDREPENLIPPFSLLNQYREIITEKEIRNKYAISAFFFTSCPTICPKMSAQMKRVQDVIQGKQQFVILYHSINPGDDTPDVLLNYARKWSAKKGSWHLLTGAADEIKKMADFYLIRAGSNSSDELIHDGLFVLTDPSGKKIGFYDGTDSVSINLMIKDIDGL